MSCHNYINPQEPALPPDAAASDHNHDLRYYTQEQVIELLMDYALSTHNHNDLYYTEAEIITLLTGYALTTHNHNDLYYTETEINDLLTGYALTSHNHDSRYYTETEIDALLIDKQDTLVSGVNISTVNGNSLLTGDDIVIIGGGGGITYTKITADQTAAVNQGYICNKASLLTLTLPASAAVGDQISVVGFGAGLWKIAQPASVQINFGAFNTTAGTGGYIQANHIKDSVQLLYTDTNLWQVISSVGNSILVV